MSLKLKSIPRLVFPWAFSRRFRRSRYIDFDRGRVITLPQELVDSTPKPWSTDQKINLFECRVEVWQLGVAAQILNEIESHNSPSIWSHSAYGLVSVVFSYFEMIGKNLVTGQSTAGEAFNRGFCDVYSKYVPLNGCYADKLPSLGPGIAASPNPDISEVKEFRDRIRNGIYHLAYTKRGLILHNDDSESTEDFAVLQKPDPVNPSNTITLYYVNPHRMTRKIIDHFPGFVARLKDTSNVALRQQYEFFFDTMHAP